MRQDSLYALGITFTSPALDPELVRVHEIRGREQLGALFEFRVRFSINADADDETDIEELLESPCVLTLGPADDDAIHGIVRDVESIESREGKRQLFQATIVPHVWLLTLSRVSRVHQNMTVAEIAQEILSHAGLGSDDFAIRPLGNPEKHEFCVQYEESDWAFLQRWFEHEGYYYWFEHTQNGTRLVISDANQVAPALPGDPELQYNEREDLVRTEQVVFSWTRAHQRTLRRIVLKDYNEQNPTLPMVGRADVGVANGFGVLFAYGEHFASADAGARLAEKRAERCRVEHLAYRGLTDCTRVRVGYTFSLADHFRSENNRSYLLTAIEHHAGLISEAGEPEVYGYRAKIEALPTDVQYRPARTTPWPMIHGVMHGHIDSDATGLTSTLDREGRYRVRLPFDGAGNKGERASCWVRMAQSYAGTGYGSHYPLHKGTEAVLAFLDGDPDRPIIIGAIPNAHTPGPSASRNATQSVVRSASGIHVVMEDASPPSSQKSN